VACRASDTCGQSNNCYFTVTVTPYVPPVTVPIMLTAVGGSGATVFGLMFTNVPGASFTVWATPSLVPPISWAPVGQPTEITNGSYSLYLFMDPQAVSNACQFYRVSPTVR
jgi:hypothetical protein